MRFWQRAMAASVIGLLGAAAQAVTPTLTLYVAPNGRDTWTGKAASPNRAGTDGPLATLAGARDRLRALRAQNQVSGPVLVSVRGGIYTLAEPFVLMPEDSGTADAPVTYAAYGHEKPIISGGQAVAGWRQESDGLWSAAFTGDIDALYVGGQRRSYTVLPKDGGFYPIAQRVPPADPKQPDDRFQFAPGDVRSSWKNLSDIVVFSFQIWNASRFRIASVDDASHVLILNGHMSSTQSWHQLKTGDRYRLENVYEALPDEPGAWYLDHAAGRLYYHPLAGETLANFSPVAPRLPSLLTFQGDPEKKQWVHDVTLKGLSFQHTNWVLPPQGHAAPQAEADLGGAINAVGARNCHMQDCRVSQVATYAVQWGRACQGNTLIGCTLQDLGAGGVKIGDAGIRPDPDDLASDNVVQDCVIENGGMQHPAAVGVWIGQSPGNRILHNDIHDLFYTGISIGWTWGYGPAKAQRNLVEYNHIYNIGRGLLSDMGGIYTLGNQEGTRLDHNLIHDVDAATYGGWGIYFDEGTTGIVAEDNVVYHTKTGGFHQHYGKDNLVQNNIFALSKEAQLQRTRAEDHVSFTFTKNIVYWDSGKLLANNWKDGQIVMDNNLYWDARPGAILDFAGMSLDDWHKAGHDTHSVIADPLFVNPATDDFYLRSNSPALTLGFHPIDLKGVGVSTKSVAYRAEKTK